jgi:hypothetical protein
LTGYDDTLLAVLAKDGAAWRIAAAQNTQVVVKS